MIEKVRIGLIADDLTGASPASPPKCPTYVCVRELHTVAAFLREYLQQIFKAHQHTYFLFEKHLGYSQVHLSMVQSCTFLRLK